MLVPSSGVSTDLVQELPDVLVPGFTNCRTAVQTDGGDVLRLILQQLTQRRPLGRSLHSGVNAVLLLSPPL